MRFQTSNCVALGVANKREAADLYRDVLGFEEVKEGGNWIEMRTGALRIFLCEDEVRVPCFDIETEDVEAAKVGSGYRARRDLHARPLWLPLLSFQIWVVSIHKVEGPPQRAACFSFPHRFNAGSNGAAHSVPLR
jgi:catechol 2,3-dioxygenase-like lactoylglutathione lyase family enzyme